MSEDGVLGRNYTRGRRYPQVIGSLPLGNGGRIHLWGGPYTYTQIGVYVVAVVVAVKTRQLWATDNLLLQIFVIVAVPPVLTWLVRRARIEGRDPIHALLGLLIYLNRPTSGSLHGSKVKIPPIAVLRTRILLPDCAPIRAATAPHLQPFTPVFDSAPPPANDPVDTPRPVPTEPTQPAPKRPRSPLERLLEDAAA